MNVDIQMQLALEELATMLDAIKRDAEYYFGMGRMQAKRKLSNGCTVTVVIQEPPVSTRRGRKAGA